MENKRWLVQVNMAHCTYRERIRNKWVDKPEEKQLDKIFIFRYNHWKTCSHEEKHTNPYPLSIPQQTNANLC